MLRRTSPGDPMNGDPAEWRNVLVEVVQDYFRNRKVGQPAIESPQDVTLNIRNESGASLAQYSVVALSTKLVIPEGDDDTFYGKLVFESAAPAASTSFAILQKPVRDGHISPARISGISPCKVSLTSTTHGYANVVASTYTHLASQAAIGAAELLHKAIPTSTQLDGAINDVVTTMTVDANTTWPDAPFVVTIGTEDILVAATSGTGNVTWSSLTRGYNSTVAAAHADNDAVAFKSGTIWCVVRFGYPATPPYSSTWTPTLTNVANLTNSTAFLCQFARVGSCVTVSGRFSATITAANTLTQMRMSLPIASNFANDFEVGGTAAQLINGGTNEAVAIYADTTNNELLFEWYASGTTTAVKYFFSGMYLIV